MDQNQRELVLDQTEFCKDYLEPELVELGSVAEITFGNVSVNVG